ncbi:MAG: lipocalin-like domain-containing protein [Novosphingobium sp.]|nr:lipocalin-like domain-containing protein [Novosphingobium sp.]
MNSDLTGSDAQRLIGSWRLVALDTGGRSAQTSGGQAAEGLIIYAQDGWMSAQIISPGQRDDGTVDHHAYFGPYSVDETAATVTHHRLFNTHEGPADVPRRYDLSSEDMLVITPLNHEGVRLTFRRAGT